MRTEWTPEQISPGPVPLTESQQHAVDLARPPLHFEPTPCAIGETRLAVDARFDRAGGEGRW